MIYTSYFGKMRKFPENFYPISIARFTPKGVQIPVLSYLAPPSTLLSTWKAHHAEDESYWEKWYDENYQSRVLGMLSTEEVLSGIYGALPGGARDILAAEHLSIADSPDVHACLLCFEKSEDFCHRHLLAEWMKERGIPVRELEDKDLVREEKEVGKEGAFGPSPEMEI